jgi:SHS2 domain-containing protein
MLVKMKTWKLLDHTADLAIEGISDTPEGALEAVCEGLLSGVINAEKVNENEYKRLKVQGMDREDTVVSILGELLYLVLAERWAVARVGVVSLSSHRAELECAGEPLDLSRHSVEEVKAATFHNFLFAVDAEGLWHLRVVFDV